MDMNVQIMGTGHLVVDFKDWVWYTVDDEGVTLSTGKLHTSIIVGPPIIKF